MLSGNRIAACALTFLLSAGAAFAQDTQAAAPSKREKKDAEKAFKRAVRLQNNGNLDAAIDAATESADLNPAEPLYVTTREYLRQQRVSEHIELGNRYLESKHPLEAISEFRAALELDPSNPYAEQRLHDALGPQRQSPVVMVDYGYAEEVQLQPKPGKKSLKIRLDGRGAWEELGRQFGFTVQADDSFNPRPVRMEIDNVDFWVASSLLRKMTKSFYVPLSPNRILIVGDTPENRRKLERTSLRTYYLPEGTGATELQEMQTMVRTMFDLRYVNVNLSANALIVRAPQKTLEAVGRMLTSLNSPRGEVLIELRVLQFSTDAMRTLGVDLPLQFTAFNLNTEARKLVNLPGGQDAINRLINSGTINAADAAALLALLSQQQSQGQSLLLKPFATFGGGNTRTGVILPPQTWHFEMNQSLIEAQTRVTLRATQGKASTFRIGDRFPVQTGTYSLLNTVPLPSSTLAGANTRPLVPPTQYEDLGITLKATPLTAGKDVSIQFEMNIRALNGVSINGVPAISNREYKGTVSLKEGETSVIAGSLEGSEARSLSGMPWLSNVPGLRAITSNTKKENKTTQLLFLITPREVRKQTEAPVPSETFLDGN